MMTERAEEWLRTGEHEAELRAELGDVLYDELRALSLKLDDAPRALAAEAQRQRVYILPGIIGSKLSVNNGKNLVWIDPIDLADGGIKRIKYDQTPDPVSATGVILATYLRMKLRLKWAGFSAEFLPYDWRKPTSEIADELWATIVSKNRKNVILVCHSMGGLVARELAERDNSRTQIKQVITLGTPNYGSYSPISVLRKTGGMLNFLGALDLTQTTRQIADRVLKYFPGLLQMLPSPQRRSINYFDQSNWPSLGVKPNIRDLKNAAEIHASVPPVDNRFVQIIGMGKETIQSADIVNNQFVFTRSILGDGTVPLDLAKAGDVERYYFDGEHGKLPTYNKAIKAVIDIIKTGSTTRLRRTPIAGILAQESQQRKTLIEEEELETYFENRAAALSQPPTAEQITMEFAGSPDVDDFQDDWGEDSEQSQPVTAAIGPRNTGRSRPRHKFGAPIDVIERAANTWKATESIRQECAAGLRGDQPIEFDTERRNLLFAKRMMRSANLMVMASGMARPAYMEALDRTDEIAKARAGDRLAQEAIIGKTTEFMSVAFFKRAPSVIRCVARIVERRSDHGFGTGFLIAPGVLITNNHVLKSRQEALESSAQFDYELNIRNRDMLPERFALIPENLFYTNKELDFTIVAVEAASETSALLSQYGYLPLDADEGKIRAPDPVNIIQHPDGDKKQAVFRKSYLRALPAGPDEQTHFNGTHSDSVLHYSGDTLAGASGSPVFSDLWEVVALHNSAVPQIDDQGKWKTKNNVFMHPDDIPSASDVDWTANQGIRISRIINHLRTLPPGTELGSQPSLVQTVLDAGTQSTHWLLETAPPPANIPSAEASSPPPEAPPPVLSYSSAPAPHTPVNITINIGVDGDTISVSPEYGVSSLHDNVTFERRRRARDYNDRTGFDPNFLGVEAPLPELLNMAAIDATPMNGSDEVVLNYDNFSLVMSGSRKLAVYVAGNYDPEAKARATRNQEPWGFDPRLSRDVQIDNRLYSSNRIDRGHLFRRADGAWGDTLKAAIRADHDTYHWTNIAPQHEVYNRSTLKKDWLLWGQLENEVAAQSKNQDLRVSVYNGPIFGENDPMYRGVALPLAYWKLIAMNSGGALKAYAFKIGQDSLIRDLMKERFEPGDFGVYQIKVRELEALVDLDFGPLRRADVMERATATERMSGRRPFVKIQSGLDIIT